MEDKKDEIKVVVLVRGVCKFISYFIFSIFQQLQKMSSLVHRSSNRLARKNVQRKYSSLTAQYI